MTKIEIRAIYDNPKFFDRYTVYLTGIEAKSGFYAYLGLSSEPTSPQGFSQFGEGMLGKHNGTKVTFNSLPIYIQKHITERIAEQ